MKLYHYANALYPQLLTRRRSQTLDPETLKKATERAKLWSWVGLYHDHISLFFDPVPLTILGKLFGQGHPVWYPGSKLYEYVLDTQDFPRDILFEVVEGPEELDLMDTTEWEDSIAFIRAYGVKLDRLKRSLGEIGVGIPALEKQIKRFAGGTEKAYVAAKKREDWIENKAKYAASVPHLMVYPSEGMLKVEQVNAVTVGSNKRTPVKTSMEAPASFRW